MRRIRGAQSGIEASCAQARACGSRGAHGNASIPYHASPSLLAMHACLPNARASFPSLLFAPNGRARKPSAPRAQLELLGEGRRDPAAHDIRVLILVFLAQVPTQQPLRAVKVSQRKQHGVGVRSSTPAVSKFRAHAELAKTMHVWTLPPQVDVGVTALFYFGDVTPEESMRPGIAMS